MEGHYSPSSRSSSRSSSSILAIFLRGIPSFSAISPGECVFKIKTGSAMFRRIQAPRSESFGQFTVEGDCLAPWPFVDTTALAELEPDVRRVRSELEARSAFAVADPVDDVEAKKATCVARECPDLRLVPDAELPQVGNGVGEELLTLPLRPAEGVFPCRSVDDVAGETLCVVHVVQDQLAVQQLSPRDLAGKPLDS